MRDSSAKFSFWIRWAHRGGLERKDLSFPGVYAIADAPITLEGRPFAWTKKIVYIGMTNSRGGLRSRLGQFQATIRGAENHGGAQRVRHHYLTHKNCENEEILNRLLVAIAPFRCDVRSNDPRDLRVMGAVARFEYECLAEFAERFGKLPNFNDKTGFPKKSS